MGVRVCGCARVWVCACVCVCVQACLIENQTMERYLVLSAPPTQKIMNYFRRSVFIIIQKKRKIWNKLRVGRRKRYVLERAVIMLGRLSFFIPQQHIAMEIVFLLKMKEPENDFCMKGSQLREMGKRRNTLFCSDKVSLHTRTHTHTHAHAHAHTLSLSLPSQ